MFLSDFKPPMTKAAASLKTVSQILEVHCDDEPKKQMGQLTKDLTNLYNRVKLVLKEQGRNATKSCKSSSCTSACASAFASTCACVAVCVWLISCMFTFQGSGCVSMFFSMKKTRDVQSNRPLDGQTLYF